MKYCRVVRDEKEIKHSAISTKDPRFGTKRPADMQKAYNEAMAKGAVRVKNMTWDEFKTFMLNYMRSALGGTGMTEFMKSETYKRYINESRKMWEKARGISKHSWG